MNQHSESKKGTILNLSQLLGFTGCCAAIGSLIGCFGLNAPGVVSICLSFGGFFSTGPQLVLRQHPHHWRINQQAGGQNPCLFMYVLLCDQHDYTQACERSCHVHSSTGDNIRHIHSLIEAATSHISKPS